MSSAGAGKVVTRGAAGVRGALPARPESWVLAAGGAPMREEGSCLLRVGWEEKAPGPVSPGGWGGGGGSRTRRRARDPPHPFPAFLKADLCP